MTLAQNAAPRHRPVVGRNLSAFTLLELLVVVSIIGLLTMLAVPGIMRARGAARAALCQINLHQIGAAFEGRMKEEMGDEKPPMRAGGWPQALLGHLDNNPDVLKCPEDPHFKIMSIEELFRVHFVGNGVDYYTMLDGPYVAKLSDSQVNDAKRQGYLRHGKRLYDIYDSFIPDHNTDVVWFWIEELHAGFEYIQPGAATAEDYEDIGMQVRDNGDGTVDLHFDLGSGEIDAHIVGMDSDTPLVSIPRGYPRDSFWAGPFAGGLGECSYGMNADVAEIKRKPGRILALDYKAILAHSSHIWGSKKWDPDGDGVPVFARHGGRINVLFVDHSVRPMRPGEIDPADPFVAGNYWVP
ncbi:hypothetical protein LCGC14_2126520 [marine sediment metagenome]|uniref:Type II secretion system protein GspG C-terminal domain-containing protein n=1 Tax=marine sediment metagenome TaxID=412755 RepID=A0A0F9E2R9_9ZZZZ